MSVCQCVCVHLGPRLEVTACKIGVCALWELGRGIAEGEGVHRVQGERRRRAIVPAVRFILPQHEPAALACAPTSAALSACTLHFLDLPLSYHCLFSAFHCLSTACRLREQQSLAKQPSGRMAVIGGGLHLPACMVATHSCNPATTPLFSPSLKL